jgi:uncharacterized protein with von Willebrand factor type A (vWA) domain
MQSIDQQIAEAKELVGNLHSERYSDLTDERFRTVLSRKVSNWETSTRIYLENTNPFKKHLSKLNFAEWDLNAHGTSQGSILKDLKNFKLLHPFVNTTFWERKLLDAQKEVNGKESKSITKVLNAIRRNEQEAWRKDYGKELLGWQLTELHRLQARFFKDLEEWFETIRQMKEVFDELDIESELLWDLCDDELSEQNISFLKRWAEYLNKAKGVRELCEMMGRLRKEQQSEGTEIISSTIKHSIRKPDIASNGMVVGIELGRELENVIPHELALLSDSDSALLFDLKYVEKRLMCFSRQSYKNDVFEETIQQTATVVDEDRMGPIIICLDTSNSMSGPSEYIAKALTLSIASQAASQKRKCYLINFSNSIDTFDLTPPKGIRDLINFLKMSFHGTTDVVPALYEGVRMMQNENYEKADLLVMSDFLFSPLSSDIISLCKEQKQNENQFFALAISPFATCETNEEVFDQTWNYNTSRGTLSEIKNCCKYGFSENLFPTSSSG